MKQTIKLIVISAGMAFGWLQAVDNPHFYRASNMFLEPRLEHDYMTTFEATLSGGSTDKGRNCSNAIVPLFDIYGTTTLPTLDPTIQNLSLGGTFKIIEANLSFAQNFAKGWLLFFHLPVRDLKIKNITAHNFDLTTLNPLLQPYCLSACPTTSIGVGDFTSYFGWTHNYQETRTLDFIDTTLMMGLLAPTGKKRDENELFSLPTGYNGHWAVPLYAMLSLGFYEWITIGASVNTLLFAPTDRTIRLKTDEAQSGIIKLSKGEVSIHKGPLVNTGVYFKADHFGHGFSFTAAYSFACQQSDHLTPKNTLPFDCAIINADATLKGWNMHTINFLAEYDFTREDSKVGNRIGLFYNLQIAGKRTFNTNITGGTYGLDIGWDI